MGLKDKLFKKKYCDLCGEQIKLFKKYTLTDGLMCKNCRDRLSVWLEYRNKTLSQEDIRAHYAYRQENQKAVEQFSPTRSAGNAWIVYLDEERKQFIVTQSANYRQLNPDVIHVSQIMSCELDISSWRREEKHTDAEGNWVSYNPPHFEHNYTLTLCIRLEHPQFTRMRFALHHGSVTVPHEQSADPRKNPEYRKYEELGMEIRSMLLNAKKSAVAPKISYGSHICSRCGGVNEKGPYCVYCDCALDMQVK